MTRSRPTTPVPDATGGALHLGVDVGGTKIAAGVVDDRGTILASTHRPSPAGDPARTLDAVLDAVRELRGIHHVRAVGVAAAGFVDAERAVVMFAPNLAWRDEPLRDEIEQRSRLPVVVENDANAVAWAEARFGAGRGESQLVALTIGTGIGGGVVIAGDVASLQVFDEVGAWLGRGIAQLAAVLDPGLVVIGGGVSAAGDLLLERVRDAYGKNLTGRGHRPLLRIEMAEFGPEAGIVGAADLARDVAHTREAS